MVFVTVRALAHQLRGAYGKSLFIHELVIPLLDPSCNRSIVATKSKYGVDDPPLGLQDRQFQNGTLVLPQGMMTGAANLMRIGRETVVRFEPQGKLALESKVPDRLHAYERLDEAKAVRRRRFVMNMGMLSINGRTPEMSRVDGAGPPW